MPRENDYLSGADDDFVDCRAMGHALIDVGDYMNGQHVHLVTQCQRCESYFILRWDKQAGTADPRQAKYTPGYLNTTGSGRIPKAEARLEKIRRTTFKSLAEFDRLMTKIDKEMEGFRE